VLKGRVGGGEIDLHFIELYPYESCIKETRKVYNLQMFILNILWTFHLFLKHLSCWETLTSTREEAEEHSFLSHIHVPEYLGLFHFSDNANLFQLFCKREPRNRPRRTHRVSGGITQLFLNRGTRKSVWSASRPGRLYPRERPDTHCTGGWVGPGAGLDRCRKSHPTGIRSPDLPARLFCS
jgi:hypothetical protein